ncbi:hypothetical protein RZN22_12705 [Bacillaceae bacterium S4-13-58]
MYDYYKDIPFDSIPKTKNDPLENNLSKTETVTFDYYQHISLEEATKN